MKKLMYIVCAAIALAVTSFAAHASVETVEWDPSWRYADRSVIHTGSAVLYGAEGGGVVVAVNAGHGTKGGRDVSVQCHPDGSPKVVSGSTEKGALTAMAVAPGMKFPDGTPESAVTLRLAKFVRDALLEMGVSVLMIRDGEDVQLDNVARTVMANERAACHISLHFDATKEDKGLFAVTVPDVPSFTMMEPVASMRRDHAALEDAVLESVRESGVNIFGSGKLAIDLVQTSYSTIPTACFECGDASSDVSDAALRRTAAAIARGVARYVGVGTKSDATM